MEGRGEEGRGRERNVRVCVCGGGRACVWVCAFMCVCMFVCACTRACVCVSLHAYLH